MTTNKEYRGRRFLRTTSMEERYDCKSPSIWRMVRQGRLPKPYYHGGKRFPRWAEDECDAADLLAQREYRRTEQELAGDVQRAKTMKANNTKPGRKPKSRRSKAAEAATI
jgi:predicted DNA-binding transcriptional regulator AlpA